MPVAGQSLHPHGQSQPGAVVALQWQVCLAGLVAAMKDIWAASVLFAVGPGRHLPPCLLDIRSEALVVQGC